MRSPHVVTVKYLKREREWRGTCSACPFAVASSTEKGAQTAADFHENKMRTR